ncbi:hypothetical protein AgCh_033113 [Apium graveolens]
MQSMKDNDVWDLVELPKGLKPISCKWVFKTKKDSSGNIERYKDHLVAKGFAHKKDGRKDDVSQWKHWQTIYMVQPENFVIGNLKTMVYKLKKSIYGLRQASREWYHKFYHVITLYGFEVNLVEHCVYHKFSGSKFIFLLLYVDDILLATNDIGLLHDTKKFLTSQFEMKDLGNSSFILGIHIHQVRSRGILGLSQKSYIEKIPERYGMNDCAPIDTPVSKGDKFSLKQCPKNELEIREMKRILYASAVGSLMHAQVCTRLDITFIVGMLGRYLSNPGMEQWKAVKRVLRYLKKIKDYMLTYRKSDHLEIIGHLATDFGGCKDERKSTSGYVYLLDGGAISWRSAKQMLVASSTMATEYITCFVASNQALWLRNFVTSLRILDGVERPLNILCDNKSAVEYSNNNSGDYVKGVVGLAKGLRKVGLAYPLVMVVLPDVPQVHRLLMVRNGYILKDIDWVQAPEMDKSKVDWAHEHFAINYSKIRIFHLQEYIKMVYFDWDIQVYDNVDELFDLPNGHLYGVLDCFYECHLSPQYKIGYYQ